MTEISETLVDINHASLETLTSLSGVGVSMANRIIEHRPYNQLSDLVRVQGISETKLAALLPFITLSTRKTRKPQSESGRLSPDSVVEKPVTTIGGTEAFVFLEDKNERQDALLIILGGLLFGLIILMLRRSNH